MRKSDSKQDNGSVEAQARFPENRVLPKGSIRIDSVQNESGEANQYTPGGTFTVLGRGFGELKEVPTDVGLYLAPTGSGRLTRVFRYTAWSDNEIRGVWPADVTGPQRLLVEIRARDGQTRSAIFGEVLQHEA